MRRNLSVALALTAVTVTLACKPSEEVGKAFEATSSLFELNTKVKQFVVVPDSVPFRTELEGYRIDVYIKAVKPRDLEGVDSFRVSVDSWYAEKVGKRHEAMATPALVIDSLTIGMTSAGGGSIPVTPGVKATDVEQRRMDPEIIRKRLRGPSYRYHLVRIPDDVETINLSFVATFVDRRNADTLSTRRVVQPLHRHHSLKYY